MRTHHLLVLCCLGLIACTSASTPSTPDASTSSDAGIVDAGTADAGVTDAGPQPCVNDTTCANPTPRCDTSTGTCVSCLLTDDNCATGFRCVETNGVPECAMGCKGDAECQQRLGAHGTCCSGVCVDTSSNSAHCSGCGLACGNGATCCDSDCTDLSADPLNCNMCGSACSVANAEPVCEASQCGIDSCKTGFDDCNHNPADGCEIDKLGDEENCGSCGFKCELANGAAKCTDGQCELWTCAKGFADCNMTSDDGCEINIKEDANNCGFCGNVCSFANAASTCTDSECGMGACNTGFANCNTLPADGCEIDKLNDPSNCGSCGFQCSYQNAAPACTDGLCALGACNTGFENCNNNPIDGCEKNVAFDVNNCGLCGRQCFTANGLPTCIDSQCEVASCNPGFDNCNHNPADGCETNLKVTVSDCGSCGFACGNGQACVNGSCVP